ncbi:hypothetical protein RJ639_030687 [Escallonia herrerae]|uniref:Pentatricopeptide repeat-containing protein n=1 Tax=Escallonia herrerae TaxID=1293975 RepID=A0AA89BE56_9ASTE|nr:hypothetical protein RJ639_030687 [Escallonia herrerae]
MDLFESLPIKMLLAGIRSLMAIYKMGLRESDLSFFIKRYPGFKGRVFDDPIVRNSLIDMYCKCGQLEKASLIFKNSPQAIEGGQYCCNESMVKSVSWSSLIAGYAQNGRIEGALKTFSTMACKDVEVDKFTVTTIISACANAGLLELGKLIHARMWKSGHGPDVFLDSVLIDAKCGRLDDA